MFAFCALLPGVILKGQNLRKFVFDVCVCMFYFMFVYSDWFLLSSRSTFLIEKVSNNAKSGGICFPKVCLLSHNDIKQNSQSLAEHV